MEKSYLGVKYVNLQVTYFLPVSSFCILPQNFSSLPLSPDSILKQDTGFSIRLADCIGTHSPGNYACKKEGIKKKSTT